MKTLRAGMVGLGMIVDETWLPFFLAVKRDGLFQRRTGLVEVELSAACSRTGTKGERLKAEFPKLINTTDFETMLPHVDVVCVATPDDRHFEFAKRAILAGKHVFIEKPSVLRETELDELVRLAEEKNVLAKVVYHKLLDPDHKKLRTLVVDGVLQHVNNGYCSLLEPKSIALGQFSEWIAGRNPATYVAVHYLKLIDFTFGPDWALRAVMASGQRGITRTWDSVQMRVIYQHADGRDAAFDIHTSWVTPDNFPGYVEQEVQFRFDNGVWNASQRKRGVELTVENHPELKTTINTHYNATSVEPWGERTQRGYGIEVLRRMFEEAAYVEFGEGGREQRLREMRTLAYNDLSADRNVVRAVEALETILAGNDPHRVVRFDL